MTYCNSSNIWNHLGKDAFTKVREEIVGTSSTTASTNYELDHDNVITSSVILYTDSTIVPTSSYTLNLDDGKIIGLTGASSGSIISVDYDYADLPDSVISQMIDSSDELIEKETGRIFDTATATEYLNVEPGQRSFFLKNYPVISMISVERNLAFVTQPPDWEEVDDGLGNDYLEDLDIGRIRWINNFPLSGENSIKVIYNYGYSTTPAIVKELSILLTIRQISNSSLYKSVFKGYDNFTPVRLNEIENRIEELKRILKKQSIGLV